MSDVKMIMTAYGVDYALTMERFMQQERMYVRILGMLFKDESLPAPVSYTHLAKIISMDIRQR